MKTIQQIKEEALNNKIPIMEDEGITFLCDLIKKEGYQEILELGSAVGYSALCMASISKDIHITTIEKDILRYNQALKNINESEYASQIDCFNLDARKYELDKEVDLVFIDAAKIINLELFNRFSPMVKKGGCIVSDDIWFHGFVDKPELVRSKHLKELVFSIKEYRKIVEENKSFETSYHQIGDGILVSKKL